MKKLIALAALALSISASAAPISPTPKQQTLGSATAFTTADATFRLSAASDADADDRRVLSDKLKI